MERDAANFAVTALGNLPEMRRTRAAARLPLSD